MGSKVRLILMVVHGVIGMSAGICGCAVFASKYGNTNAAVWAGISAFVALLYVQASRSVYRDVNRVISPQCFLVYIFIAGIFVLAGSVVMITYLCIGLVHKEDLSPTGSYVVIVWGFMIFKWALFVLFSSRKFHKQYCEMEGNEPVVAIND